MRVVRRLGPSTKEHACTSDLSCPDLFELSDGRYAVIGADMTAELRPLVPADAGVAPHERIVVVSREVLMGAKGDIPDA